MGRASQGTAMSDRTGDGLVNNRPGSRGVEVLGADDSQLLRASTADDGSNEQVFIPVDLLVQGQTLEADDSVVADLEVGDGNLVLLRADATAEPPVMEIDADLKLSGEVQEGQQL